MKAPFSARTHVAGPNVSAEPRQYVVSIPTGFVAAAGRFRADLASLNDPSSNVTILGSLHEQADKLVQLDEEGVRRFRVQFPSLTLEPNLHYRVLRHPTLAEFDEVYVAKSQSSTVVTVRVQDASSGAPVVYATVYLALGGRRPRGFRGKTNDQGEVQFLVPTGGPQVSSVSVVPLHGYWSQRVAVGHSTSSTILIALRPLPAENVERYDWGHRHAGMFDEVAQGGRTVRVGVIDTGIVRDHPDLPGVTGRNCVFGEPESDWFRDEDGHGTHCAGVIAANITGRGVKGYAPRVELRAYRIFKSGESFSTTYALSTALQQAVDDKCDIISMSIGSPMAQSTIRNKIEYAYDNGVMCIAATGNEADRVSYPAAFPNVFGVSAFGQKDTFPPDSLHADAVSDLEDAAGQQFWARFSNFGDQLVDFCALGVAICSTVPGGGYAAWDGTSMACPQVTGMAALALAHRPALLHADRTSQRVDQLEVILRTAAQPLGFGADREGSGVLHVTRLL